jgi:sugar/nucleoside kinase (ribokinase family)
MAHARRGIAAAGNWIIDHIFICDRWPQEETLANIVGEDQGTGGAPYNCLVDLARFGPPDGGEAIPLEAVGLIGDDADGASIRADCDALGIDASALATTAEAPTSYTNVMVVEATGRRTFFHNRGANALFGPEHVPVEAIRARLVHLGYLLLLDRMDEPDAEYGTVAARLLARLREAGIQTSIDVVSEDSDRFPKIVKPALAHADYAILNELEAGRTTGHDLKPGGRPDPAAVRASAEALLGLGVGRLVCIHMPEGAYVRTADGEEVWQPALRLPNGYVKGAAGAGDAFCAGLLFGLHEGWEIQRGLRLGVCAAARSLSRPGCTEACTTLADTLALADEFPFQAAVM